MTIPDGAPPDAMRVDTSHVQMLWIVLVAVSASALSMLYLPMIAGGVACGVLLVYGWWTAGLHALQLHATAITALRCVPDSLSYQLKGGEWLTGKVLSGGLISRWITVVRLQDTDLPVRVRYLVLLVSQMNADEYRRLRVHLKWNVDRRRKHLDF